MIIFRYISREVVSTLCAVTLLLLVIFLSRQFVRYLGEAASGHIPSVFVLRLMLLEIPHLLSLLLPLGLYLGLLFTIGRLHTDYEMTVLSANGMSEWQFVRMILLIAGVVAIVAGGLSLYLSPHILKYRDYLLTAGRSASIVETIIPGQFQSINHGKLVIFVEQVSRDRQTATHIFLAQQVGKTRDNWRTVFAKRSQMQTDDNGERFVVLEDGEQFSGKSGEENYQIVQFKEYGIRIPDYQPTIRKVETTLSVSQLIKKANSDPKYAAEWQWRLALPIMTLVLALLAISFARVQPRQGKYSKLLPAVLFYIVYANGLFASRSWLAKGTLSPELGLWWVHGSMLFIALLLLIWPRLKWR